MEAHKRNRNPKYKSRYQGVNWAEYEKNLRNRGNVCLWLSPDVIRKWDVGQSRNMARINEEAGENCIF